MLNKNKKYRIQDALKFIWSYVKKYKGPFYAIIIFSLLAGVLENITPYIFGRIIDGYLGKELIFGLTINQILIFWVITVVVKMLLNRAIVRFVVWLEIRVSKNVTYDLSTKILSLPVKYHYDQKPGDIFKKVDRATSSVEMIVDSMLFNFLPNILSVIISFVIILQINRTLVYINLIVIVIYFLFATTFRMKSLLTLRKKANRQFNMVFGNIGDFMANIFTVKTNTAEKFELKKLDNDYNLGCNYVDKQMKVWTQVSLGQGIITHGGTIISFVFGSYLMMNKMITPGEFSAFMIYLLSIYKPLGWMSDQYRGIKRMMVDISDAQNILKQNPEKSTDTKNKDFQINGDLEFKNVSFKYPLRNQGILNKVNFKIKAGETLAIFGETGSGKTTLYNLLLRLYDHDNGQILIDNQDINKMDRQTLREQIAVVPQDPSLFNDSILYNIKYGRPEASQAEVIEAAKIANAHDFITALPHGYKTKVGERGVKLSGGQVQRIAIARAALRNPKILILDEATSSLDQKTKFTVLDALSNLIKGRTTIIITHDFSAITQSADQIIVLDKGKIVEKGNHQQLVVQAGIYHDLWLTQQQHLQQKKSEL